jgi:hypothetical protein
MRINSYAGNDVSAFCSYFSTLVIEAGHLQGKTQRTCPQQLNTCAHLMPLMRISSYAGNDVSAFCSYFSTLVKEASHLQEKIPRKQ